MSKFARLVVLVTALSSLFAVLSATAGAVTWHNTGGTAFHATGGPMTYSRGSVSLTCAGSTATGTAAGGSTVAQHYNVVGTITYSPCGWSGQWLYIHCNYNFTGTTQPVATGPVAGSMALTCVSRLTATNSSLCHIEGSTHGVYINPSVATPGRVTLVASNTLTITNAGNPCPLGTGGLALMHQTITFTSVATSPHINRTA